MTRQAVEHQYLLIKAEIVSVLSEYGAHMASKNGEFLLAGDMTHDIKKGAVIRITERCGLLIKRVGVTKLLDVPQKIVLQMCLRVDIPGKGPGIKRGYRPHYSQIIYETAHQAALAQAMHDAGEGFAMDDILDLECLDAEMTVVRVIMVTNYAHQHRTVQTGA